MFEALVHPLSEDQFLREKFAIKSIAIKCGNIKRFEYIIQEYLWDLKLKKMCKNSASDKISICYPNKVAKNYHTSPSGFALVNEDPVKTFESDDYQMAFNSYDRGGASLLLKGSKEFTKLFIDNLNEQMGFNYGIQINDSSAMGEIKIFCSKKGSFTDFHMDSSECFTLQLKGSQRWRLHDSGIRNPIEGYSSQYWNPEHLENQAKILQSTNGVNIQQTFNKRKLLRSSTVVNLDEGDILYHPSGIWEGVRFYDQKQFTTKLEQSLKQMLAKVQEFKESWEINGKLALQEGQLFQREQEFDLESSIEENGGHSHIKIGENNYMKFNQLFSLLKNCELPQVTKDARDAQYILNGLFGREDLQSQVRIILYANSEEVKQLMDKIVSMRSGFTKGFTVSQVLSKNEQYHKKQIEVLRSLSYLGLLLSQQEEVRSAENKPAQGSKFDELAKLVMFSDMQKEEGNEDIDLTEFRQFSKNSNNNNYNEIQSDEAPNLSHSHSHSRHKYHCHQCHSEILSDNKQSSTLRASDSKKKSPHQRKKSYQRQGKQHKRYSKHGGSSEGTTSQHSFVKLEHHEESHLTGDEFEESHIYTDSQVESIDLDAQILPKSSTETQPAQAKEQTSRNQKVKTLDLAFLFADPLMLVNKWGKLVPMNQPLDTETEFREIQKIISHTKKQFLMRKDAANFETLKTIISKKPMIIHISCHGDYDEASKQYYLAFEEKDTGILDKLSQERFKRLLGEGHEHRVHLAFVSACHSEMIGQLFLKAKVPVVVAVNSHSMILDEVCQLFARHFYNSLLVGESPKIAFKNAQDVCRGGKFDLTSCCCAHSHTPNCSWVKYAQKHGYEKAHEIHTPKQCFCNLEGNKHKARCNILAKFLNTISEFEEMKFTDPDFQIDSNKLKSFDENQTLCCCRPSDPHDESMKFMLYGEDHMQQRPIFVNREDGEVQIEADVNENNRLPYNIDSTMLIGRNAELQKIVTYLCSEKEGRLIHIYGPEGVGKSSIAKYAAKYTVDRRVFPHGVYYIDCSNRTSGQGILQKVCQKMQIQSLTKEQFVNLIKMNTILIIFDNCKNVIEQGKESFNKHLKYLILNTSYLEIMVVSSDKSDIKEFELKKMINIDELTRENAAKLLLKAGENTIHLKSYKRPEDLAKHSLFDLISYKPSGIVQLAPLLQYQTLDEIVKEKQRILQEEKEATEIQQQKKNMEYGEFSWILNILYNKLSTQYKIEMSLLYLMCQTPYGLTELDIEFICTEKPSLYGKWKEFLEEISKTESTNSDDENQKVPQQVYSKHQNFRMVTSNFVKELQENHYVVQPIVIEYINTLVLKKVIKETAFLECFRYLSKMSRRLLRSIKYSEKKEIDLQILSNEIDLGMWSDTRTQDPIEETLLNQQLIYNPVVKFNYNESNFTAFIQVNILKQHFQKLDYNNVNMYYLEELITNTVSNFVLINRYDEAIALINKSYQITEEFKTLRYLRAKLEIMECSIKLKLKKFDPKQTLFTLDHAFSALYDLGFYEGAAEANFLQALTLIKSLNNLLLGDEQALSNMYSSGSLNVERNDSDLVPELNRLKSPMLQSNSSLLSYYKLPIEQQRQREANEVLKKLKDAMKLFQRENCQFGLAKSQLLFAEFEIDNKYGTGINLEYDSASIRDTLEKCYLTFNNLGIQNLKARALRNLAEVNLFDEQIYDAKRNIEEALKIIRRIQDTNQEACALSALNKIHHMIRIKSNNCFIFAKAFPLIEVINEKTSQFRNIGPFTRYPSDFRKRVQEEIQKQGKVINLKFDTLKRQHLDYLKTYGCRVLHLSSDIYKKDCLCIEGNNSEVEYVTIDEMKKLLSTETGKLPVDVVVLAIPESKKLGQMFVELGVPHVVAFDFNEEIVQSTFMDNVYFHPKRFQYIYDFCVEFYKNLINEYSVYRAWKEAKPLVTQKIKELKQNLKGVNFSEKDLGRGVILLPSNQEKHQVKLFNSKSVDPKHILESGDIIDTSRLRAPTNIKKVFKPYTGRQIENFAVLCHLKKSYVKIINVSGLDGIGKTRFVEEVGYQINQRQQFLDGIFIVDLRKSKNIDQLKRKLKDINIGGGVSLDLNTNLQNKSVLLILDNVDKLIKHSKTQFEWWMQTLFQQCENLKLMITSKRKISMKEQKELSKQVRYIQLKPLNDIEAVDMLLSNCVERQIRAEELHLRPNQKDQIHQQLQEESTVKKCCGFPKYLNIFAQLLEVKDFNKIDIVGQIPKKKNEKIQGERRKTIKRMQKNEQNNENQGSSKEKKKVSKAKRIVQEPIQEEDENLEKSSITVKHQPPLNLNDSKKKSSDRMRASFSHAKMFEEDKREFIKKSSYAGDDQYFYEDTSHDLKQSQICSSRKGRDDSSEDESVKGKIKVRTENMRQSQFKHPENLSKSIGPGNDFFDQKRLPNNTSEFMLEQFAQHTQMMDDIFSQSHNAELQRTRTFQGQVFDQHNIPNGDQYFNWGRDSMMEKLRGTDPDAKVTIEIPQNPDPGLTREVSIFSQQAEEQQDQNRSRSGSDIITGTGDLKFSLYPSEGLKKSIPANKPYLNQVQPKVEEREEEQLGSRGTSQINDPGQLSTMINIAQSQQEETKASKFDLSNDEDCVISEKYDGQLESQEDEELDQFQNEDQISFQDARYQKQKSNFTTSSGKPSSHQSFKKQNSDRGPELISNKKGQGSKSGRHKEKYKKKIKNQMNDVKQEQKKKKKDQDKKIKKGQLQKLESSENVNDNLTPVKSKGDLNHQSPQ